MAWSRVDRYKQTCKCVIGLLCFFSSAGDIVSDVKVKLRRHKHLHDVISLEASEIAAFVLSNIRCCIKPPGLFSLISEGFVCSRYRSFSGSLRIDCMAYFRDSVLSAVWGFAPRIVFRSLLNNPSACCQQGLARVGKASELPVLVQKWLNLRMAKKR